MYSFIEGFWKSMKTTVPNNTPAPSESDFTQWPYAVKKYRR